MGYIRKLTPVPCSNVSATQAWLEDLAAQGLFLVKYRPLFCTFRRESPARVRYRLDLCRWRDGEVPCQLEELCREQGWTYVCTAENLFYIFLCRDGSAPELNTDPAALAPVARKLHRRLVLNAVLSPILLLCVIPFLLLPFQSEAPLRTFIDEDYPVFLPLLLLVPVSIIQAFQSVRWSRRLTAQLAAGIPLPDRAPVKSRAALTVLSFACLCLVAVFFLLFHFILPAALSHSGGLDQSPAPVLPLTQLYPQAEYSSFVYEGTDYARFYQRSFVSLSPTILETTQRGTLPNAAGGEPENVGLLTRRYELLLSPLAQPLTRDLARSALSEFNDSLDSLLAGREMAEEAFVLEPLSLPQTDLALGLRSQAGLMCVFLCRDNVVLSVRCYGPHGLEQLLPHLPGLLELSTP